MTTCCTIVASPLSAGCKNLRATHFAIRSTERQRQPRIAACYEIADHEFDSRFAGGVGSGRRRLCQIRASVSISRILKDRGPRNGTIEAVRFASIVGDHEPEIVIVIRSAASGGYLAADAFRWRGKTIELVASLADLDSGADPIAALRDKL